MNSVHYSDENKKNNGRGIKTLRVNRPYFYVSFMPLNLVQFMAITDKIKAAL